MSAARKPPPPPFVPAANDAPRLVTIEKLTAERGFKSNRAAREWLKRHKIPSRRDGRNTWVDANDVDAAIASLPARQVGQSQPPPAPVSAWVSALTSKAG